VLAASGVENKPELVLMLAQLSFQNARLLWRMKKLEVLVDEIDDNLVETIDDHKALELQVAELEEQVDDAEWEEYAEALEAAKEIVNDPKRACVVCDCPKCRAKNRSLLS
jgi:alpha-glucuronidase